MKTKYEYIYMELIVDTGKTTSWYVYNHNRINLGSIKWYPGWRTYCFSPSADTFFDDKCLNDISDFISQLKDIRKERLVKEKT